ncbi:MAG: hypothetical protein RR840_02580 [Clostridium sp.]
MIRVFGVGGSIYPNENIGDIVVSRLEELGKKKGIEYYPYTVDYHSLIKVIHEDDYIIVVDGTLYGMAPGFVTKVHLESIRDNIDGSMIGSLIDKILKHDKNLRGILIGIETAEPLECEELDRNLKSKINNILCEVQGIINREYIKIKST